MALLKFICRDCGEVFEELVFGDKKPECPKCKGKETERFYPGKCNFGPIGGSGKGCSGSCATCKGCSH
ncbi:MAG: zinc ribbon domain-containing protein [Clostridia bacterium]|nr:zinc ribbon domain-containing protein [Clostridia bacterium]